MKAHSRDAKATSLLRFLQDFAAHSISADGPAALADHGHHSVTQGCLSEIVESLECGAELEQRLELWGRVRVRHLIFPSEGGNNYPRSSSRGGIDAREVVRIIGETGPGFAPLRDLQSPIVSAGRFTIFMRAGQRELERSGLKKSEAPNHINGCTSP